MTGMPSWKSTLSETGTWELVHFIHALPELDAKAGAQRAEKRRHLETAQSWKELIQYGRTLYRQEGCFMCHQLNGEAGNVAPNLTVEGTRGRTEEWLVGHFKDPPAYTPGSLMPALPELDR
jgi:cbb3-type cytochrome oxidase cytochrome c subunit